jgi:hypothetical protein
MEKHGKIKIVQYSDEENISVKHSIVIDDIIHIAFIQSYDETILVKPNNMPKWLVTKIRENKVKRNDDIIVTIKENGETLIELEEAIVELPKPWSHSIENLFEERFTATEVREMIIEFNNRLTDLYNSDLPKEAKEQERSKVFEQLNNKLSTNQFNNGTEETNENL